MVLLGCLCEPTAPSSFSFFIILSEQLARPPTGAFRGQVKTQQRRMLAPGPRGTVLSDTPLSEPVQSLPTQPSTQASALAVASWLTICSLLKEGVSVSYSCKTDHSKTPLLRTTLIQYPHICQSAGKGGWSRTDLAQLRVWLGLTSPCG